MPLIRSWMNGNSLGPKFLQIGSHLKQIRHITPPSISKCSYFININTKCCHLFFFVKIFASGVFKNKKVPFYLECYFLKSIPFIWRSFVPLNQDLSYEYRSL